METEAGGTWFEELSFSLSFASSRAHGYLLVRFAFEVESKSSDLVGDDEFTFEAKDTLNERKFTYGNCSSIVEY
jgi:hypothetical protein